MIKIAAILSTIAALYSIPVLAQEPHVHGGEIPDWYDPACCSKRDCKPVDDTDIEFGSDQLGNTYARYKPTGHIFHKNQFRLSQDERYHVCINPNATYDDDSGTTGALCFYDRSGV